MAATIQTKGKQYLFGVDIGTYSTKGVIVEARTGDIVATKAIEHSVSNPKPGWAEHDADKVWWGEFVAICQKLITESKIHPQDIMAVGTSGLGACVLPVDPSGKPLRNAILYGIDTRALDEIDELEKVFGKKKIFEISLMNLSTQSTGPKILWLKNNEPNTYKDAKCYLTSEAYLVFRLTGKYTLDYLTAADYAPMFNVRKNCWEEETAIYITPLEKLTEISWSCKVAGFVTRQAASETGLSEGTPVIVGTTDGGSEALSAGVSIAGDMMMMFGSSFYFILKTEKLIPTELIWSSAWLEEGAYTLQGGTSTSGSLTRWFRDNLAPIELAAQKSGEGNAYALLADLLGQSQLGANGLIALPYFEGERTPIYDPKAKGVLFGLSMCTTRADIYRALLEGVGFGILHIIDEMHKIGIFPRRFLAVGGGIQNLGWMQIISNITNIEMFIPQKKQGACYGDAFMAGVGVGLYENLGQISQWVKTEMHIKPDTKAHNEYENIYRIYRDLYGQTKDSMHKIYSLTRK